MTLVASAMCSASDISALAVAPSVSEPPVSGCAISRAIAAAKQTNVKNAVDDKIARTAEPKLGA
mgnify:CR=1 FL=1